MHNSALLTTAALQVMDLTIVGSWVLLTILLLRFFWHKMPRRFIMPMWALAGMRLMLPITIESPTSTIPPETVGIPQQIFFAGTTQMQMTHGEQVVAAAAKPLRTSEILALIWLAGFVLMILWGVISYLRLKHSTACATPLGEGVYECDACHSPFVLGFIRPRIILPYGMDEAQRELVLNHERSHISRFDHLKKPIGWLVLATHWFNPLVWAGFTRFCKDIERDCDERSISGLDFEQRKAYSEALLQFSTDEKLFNHPLAFGELDTKWRIQRVLSYRKPAKYMAVIGVIGVIIMIFCLMTNPNDSENASSIGIIGGADGPTAIIVGTTIKGDTLDYKTYTALADTYAFFPVITYTNSAIEDKRVDAGKLADFLEATDWKVVSGPAKHDPVQTIDFRIGAYLHLYSVESGLASIQSGGEFRYYEIPRNDHIELRALTYYPTPADKIDDVTNPDIPGTPAVGIPRDMLLAMAGKSPSSFSFDDLISYDYYPASGGETRDYFTDFPGFYLRVSAPDIDSPIESMKLIYVLGSGMETAVFFETFDISAYTADEIETIIAEYPEYAAWNFTMDDWETDEKTKALPKPEAGKLMYAVRFYQTPSTQITLESVDNDQATDYCRKLSDAGFEQVAYNVSTTQPNYTLNALYTNSEYTVSLSHSGGVMAIAITEGEFRQWNS